MRGCSWRRGITGDFSARGSHRRHYRVLHGVCGPKRTALPPPCAGALAQQPCALAQQPCAACIPHGGCEAMAYSDTHLYGATRNTRRDSVSQPPWPQTACPRLGYSGIQFKRNVRSAYRSSTRLTSPLRIYSCSHWLQQRSACSAAKRSPATRAAGHCGVDVRAVGTTRGTLQSTLHVPTDPTEGYTGTDGAATRLRPGGARSGASV
jgi:hypothetical protein